MVLCTAGSAEPGGSALPRSAYHWVIMLGPSVVPDELEKMVRVIRKVEVTAPHAVLLVLDATVGQNALSQVEIFGKIAGVTGLVMTKLDGTAKGGILVAIADKFGLPVHFIGVGEAVEDLVPFTAHDFARAVVGLES